MNKKINLKLIIFIITLISIIVLPNFSFATGENTVMILKQAIAMWYYIIRTISIAVMLVLLIFIGIKMAISTVASDKALYKRMLMDWVAGMILVFGIHYVMIFIINLNEVMVNTIAETSEAIYEANPSEYGKTEDKDKTNNDIETSVFDAVRTRAYDPKLINGTTGMIMYAYLVYYAYKFSFKYLKRYLTVAVLTLMAPIVAVSYSFSKVLTGKTKIFSKWLKEYFFNVFLQTIHALIYVVFVLMSLRLSLNSISGMLLAFVLLNYMSKADRIFRKIFGIGGSGSLVDDIADKDVGRDLVNSVKGLTKAYAGNKIIKAVAKKERAIMAKPAQKAFGAAMAFTRNHFNNNKEYHLDENGKETDFKEKDFKKFRDGYDKKFLTAKSNYRLKKLLSIQRHSDALKEGDTSELEEMKKEATKEFGENSEEVKNLEKEIEALKGGDDETIKAKLGELDQQEEIAFSEFSRTRLALTLSAKEKLSEAFDPSKYTEYDEKKGKYVGLRTKYKGRMIKDENGNLVHVDARRRTPWQGRFTEEFQVKDSIGKRMKENINAKTLLGMTEEDKELLNENIDEIKDVTIGFFSGLFSLAMVIENPVIGVGLMTNSIASKNKLLVAYNKKNKSKTLPVKIEGNTTEERLQSMNEALAEYEADGKLTAHTIQSMRSAMTKELSTARDRYIINDINKNHIKSVKALVKGTKSAVNEAIEEYKSDGKLTVHTMQNMRSAMTKELFTARDEYIASDISKKHPKFAKSLVKGAIVVGGGPAGIKLVRSISRSNSSGNTVVRTGGLGYAEREHNLKQFANQDKANRKTEDVTMNRVLVNMFGEAQKDKLKKDKAEIESLSMDVALSQAAVEAGLAVMVGGILVPLTNEPITEEKIIEALNAKKAESEENVRVKNTDKVDEIVNDELISKMIIQAFEQNDKKYSSVTEFTTLDEKNQEKIVDQIVSVLNLEENGTNSKLQKEVHDKIEQKVTKVKAEMVLKEMVAESFTQVASAEDVHSIGDIKIENVQASVEEKMQEWSKTNLTQNGISDGSLAVVDQMNNGKIENSEEKSSKMKEPIEALDGKSVQDLIEESVKTRYDSMTTLNSKKISEQPSEDNIKKMKEALLAKKESESQKLLLDILTEQNEEKVQELLETASEEDKVLATIGFEIKRNNKAAMYDGIKSKPKKHINDTQSYQTRKDSSGAVSSLNQQRQNELKGSQTKKTSEIDGPLTDLNELIGKIW